MNWTSSSQFNVVIFEKLDYKHSRLSVIGSLKQRLLIIEYSNEIYVTWFGEMKYKVRNDLLKDKIDLFLWYSVGIKKKDSQLRCKICWSCFENICYHCKILHIYISRVRSREEVVVRQHFTTPFKSLFI